MEYVSDIQEPEIESVAYWINYDNKTILITTVIVHGAKLRVNQTCFNYM